MVGVNQAFEQALEALRRLEATEESVARLRLIPELRLTLEEARAYFNFEMHEFLRDRAEADWARFGKLRRELDAREDAP